jgi:hypothetical protein
VPERTVVASATTIAQWPPNLDAEGVVNAFRSAESVQRVARLYIRYNDSEVYWLRDPDAGQSVPAIRLSATAAAMPSIEFARIRFHGRENQSITPRQQRRFGRVAYWFREWVCNTPGRSGCAWSSIFHQFDDVKSWH